MNHDSLKPFSTVQLLVSVRNVAEARAALEGGADVIDVKEPARGPLGMADFEVIHSVSCEITSLRRAAVTAALGDLRDWTEADKSKPPPAILFGKVGFAGERQLPDWPRRFAWLAALWHASFPLIPVAYADAERANSPDVNDVAALAIKQRSPFLLFDTFQKDGSALGDWLSDEAFRKLAAQCHASGVRVAAAGSLTAELAVHFASLGADVVAVRGAACRDGRLGVVDAEQVRDLKRRLIGVVAPSPVFSESTFPSR